MNYMVIVAVMLDSEMCPVHVIVLLPLPHIPSLLNHPLIHLQDVHSYVQVLPFFKFQFLLFFEAI